MINDILADAKLAVDLEKKGYEFYTKSAEKTNNPLVSSTLTSLAERELTHINAIKAIYKKKSEEKDLGGDWLRGLFVPLQKKDLLKLILNRLKDNLDKKVEVEKDLTEIYETAKGFERDSVSFYEKLSKTTPQESLKSFFAALAIEENEHFIILDESLQYLNNPGEWFKNQERWIIEG